MKSKVSSGGKAPKSCQECIHWKEVKDKVRIAEILAKAIEGIEKRLKAEDFKATVGDYLKLVQMEKELEQQAEETKEIKVTWVEPSLASDSEK